MRHISTIIIRTICLGLLAGLNACSSIGNTLNPFYESPTELALSGEKNDHAISGDGQKIEKARSALESMASYQRAHDPQPTNPVMNPAVVRLMWVPDHLSTNGDLVPSHYYYLKVRDDYWAVTDSFDIEKVRDQGSGGSTSNVPFVHPKDNY